MSELIKKILVSNSIFKKDTIHTEIDGFFNPIKGTANKIYFSNSIKASLGEFSERFIELSNHKDIKKISALNISNNKPIQIDADKVYLLRKNTTSKTADFYDSSGTAFFTNSEQAINKAFFEFIERQSLVYSFLRKWPGQKINTTLLKSRMQAYKKYNFSAIFANDISIVNKLHVVLLVAISKNSYNVGLGTDYNLSQALSNALAEGIGSTPFFISNSEIDRRSLSLNYIDKYFKSASSDVSSYEDIFFNRLTPEFVLNRFLYLKSAPLLSRNNKNNITSSPHNLNLIKQICATLPISPSISFLNGDSNIVHNNVIHFSAKGAYPHIFTPYINPNIYKISYTLHYNNNFPNIYKYLPFP